MNCRKCGVPLGKNDKDETKDHCGFCSRKLNLIKHEKQKQKQVIIIDGLEYIPLSKKKVYGYSMILALIGTLVTQAALIQFPDYSSFAIYAIVGQFLLIQFLFQEFFFSGYTRTKLS